MWPYILVAILSIIAFELFFRKAAYKLLMGLVGLLTRLGVRIIFHWRKILRAAIQLLIDFGLFWFVFLWRDGQIVTGIGGGLSQFGNWCATTAEDVGGFFAGLWQWFVGLAPTGIETPQGLSFVWCLGICMLFTVTGLIIALIFSFDDTDNDLAWFPRVIIPLGSAFLHIYTCYWVCHLTMQIQFSPHWLAWIAKILATVISGVVILIPAGIVWYLLLRCADWCADWLKSRLIKK